MARRKKPKQSDTRTLVAIVLDKSGSMDSRRKETIDAMNEYVNTLRREGKGEIIASMIQFDDPNYWGYRSRSGMSIEETYTSKPIDKVPTLGYHNYAPRGMTPLYDAIGHMIRTIEKEENPDDKVIVVIMTDGLENASKEHNKTTITKLRDEKETSGWEFVFLGAGEQAWEAGRTLGFRATQTVNYGTQDVQDHKDAVYLAASASVTTTESLRGARASESFLTASPEKSRLERKAKGESPRKPRRKSTV